METSCHAVYPRTVELKARLAKRSPDSEQGNAATPADAATRQTPQSTPTASATGDSASNNKDATTPAATPEAS